MTYAHKIPFRQYLKKIIKNIIRSGRAQEFASVIPELADMGIYCTIGHLHAFLALRDNKHRKIKLVKGRALQMIGRAAKRRHQYINMYDVICYAAGASGYFEHNNGPAKRIPTDKLHEIPFVEIVQVVSAGSYTKLVHA